MPEIQTDQSRLDELAELFVERYRRGERPAISDYVREHPDLAHEIEELFPALAMMEQVEGDLRKAAKKLPATGEPEIPITQLGDFRIIREVGRGGMGVVYEAEQVSLGRRVALKVLPKHLLSDSKHRKRFEREARAAGRLHHTNIVPVYGVGEQDGMHYYVMQFIDGMALDEVLVELKRLREQSEAEKHEKAGGGAKNNGAPPQDQVCRVGGGAATRDASAAGIANSLISGCFERTKAKDSDSNSISEAPQDAGQLVEKPSPPGETIVGRSETLHGSGAFSLPGQNEIRSKGSSRNVYWQSVARIGVQAAEALHYAHEQGIIHRDVKPGNLLLDNRGCVWVTDFGLAKAADQRNLTHTGDVLGTLRYMAPEQFDGKADTCSDVYSLGITLYELLSMQAAFHATNRPQLVRQVIRTSPPRLRTLDRRIPRDLETIVHRAIEHDPSHRYQTADELAADLSRYLGDEPIWARRVSPLVRLQRWCKRNKAIAALSLVMAALLAIAALISTAAAIAFRGQRNDLDLALTEIGRKSVLLQQERDRAVAAERERTDHLVDALFEKARGNRAAGRMGRRFDGLKSLADATELVRSLDLAPSQLEQRLLQLRNEAIACLALPDFDESASWKIEPLPWGSLVFDFDPQHQCYAHEQKGGAIALRRVADHSLVGQFPRPGAKVRWMRFSPDGRRLAAAYSNLPGSGFSIWNTETFESILRGSVELAQASMDFSSAGPHFAIASADRALHVFDLEGAREVETFSISDDADHLRFSPDGQKIAISTNSGKMQIWDWRRRALAQEWAAPDRLHGLDWRMDGNAVAAACEDGKVYVRDLSTNRELVLAGHRHVADDVAFYPQGQFLFSTSWDGTTRLWDLESRTELMQTYGHMNRFSEDGGQVALRLGKEFRLGVREFDPARECRMLYAHHDTATHVHNSAFSTRLPLMATCGSDGVRLWDTTSWRELAALETDWTPSVAFHPRTGNLWTAGLGGVCEWPLRVAPSGSARQVRIGPPRRVETPGIPQPHRLVISRNGGALAVNGEHGEEHVVIIGNDETAPKKASCEQDCRFTALSPDGRWLAVGPWQGRGVSIFEAASGDLVQQLPSTGATSVAFSPDGVWLATCDEETVQFYRAGSWEQSHAHATPGVGYITFSPDSTVLAVGTLLAGEEPNAVHLVQAATGRLLAKLESTPNPTQIEEQITFSPDGGYVVAPYWRDRAFCVWDLGAIRRKLSQIGLDWEGSPLRTPPEEAAPIHVTVVDPQRVLSLLDRLEAVPITKTDAQLVDESIEDFSRAIDSGPRQAQWWVLRGRLHWVLGRDREALQDFSDAIAHDPDDVSAIYYRARTHWWNHNLREAIADYQDVLRRDPNHKRALLEGAMSYSLCPPWPSNAERALELADRYFAHHGDSPTVRHSKGLALCRLGRFDEAEREIQRAIQRGVSWRKPHLELAAIYHARGDRDRALAAYEAAKTEAVTSVSSENAKENFQRQQEIAELLGLSAKQPEPNEPLVLKGSQLLLSADASEGRQHLSATRHPETGLALHWRPAHMGARLTFSVHVLHPGRYRVSGHFHKSGVYGRLQLSVSGAPLGEPFDGYAPEMQPSAEVAFGDADFELGENTITVEIVGSDSRSDGYQAWIDQMTLTPIDAVHSAPEP